MKKILFYYCLLLALFISISGIISSKNTSSLLFQLFFMPITIYFIYSVLIQFFDKKTKPIISSTINRGTLFITIVLFLFLVVTSIIRITKKPPKLTKQPVKIVLSPSPKLVITPYLRVKSEYLKDVINVRKSATSTSTIIGILDTGKKYQIISKKDRWYEIIYDQGLNGFVNEKFISTL